jgi:Na+(H+)/acetate symporter ActP
MRSEETEYLRVIVAIGVLLAVGAFVYFIQTEEIAGIGEWAFAVLASAFFPFSVIAAATFAAYVYGQFRD